MKNTILKELSVVDLVPFMPLLSEIECGEHFDEDHKNFSTRYLVSTIGEHFAVDRVEYMGYLAYPLLAFPDVYDFSKMLPITKLAQPLLALDRSLASVPLVRRLGWGIIVKAHREP